MVNAFRQAKQQVKIERLRAKEKERQARVAQKGQRFANKQARLDKAQNARIDRRLIRTKEGRGLQGVMKALDVAGDVGKAYVTKGI